MKKPSSKIPLLETMVWFPERDWPWEMVSDAMDREMLIERGRKRATNEKGRDLEHIFAEARNLEAKCVLLFAVIYEKSQLVVLCCAFKFCRLWKEIVLV